MKVLRQTQFGNPILRREAQQVPVGEIMSDKIQTLIKNMRYTLRQKKLGVGLAAPQVGQDLAIAVISVRPTKHRSKVKKFDLVIINPVITKSTGRKKQLWEGCISAGSSGEADLFAKVPRYEEIKVAYYDESGKKHTRTFKGLPAQIIQHETDHLDGILFVDRVKDTKTFMSYSEYKKRVKNN
jgi:peptide deformylase